MNNQKIFKKVSDVQNAVETDRVNRAEIMFGKSSSHLEERKIEENIQIKNILIKFYDKEMAKEMDKELVEAFALAYKQAFEGKPWGEEWPMDKACTTIKRYIEDVKKGKSFITLLSPEDNEKEIIGFSIMYSNYLIDIIGENGKPFKYQGYYLSEFGIIPEYQKKGLGKILLKSVLQKLLKDGVVRYTFRTINDIMVKLSKKYSEVSIIGKLERDIYPDRFYRCCKINQKKVEE